MKVSQISKKVKDEKAAILGCDISSEKIDAYSEIGDVSIETVISNNSVDIPKQLLDFQNLAKDYGYSLVRVVAEPSGSYGELLFRTAIKLGMETAWVSGEAVAKTRAIENNSNSKTDPIDSKAIFTLAMRGTTLKHRLFAAPYAALREWNGIYEAADKGVVRAKNEFHDHLKRLFPDFGFKKEFLYGRSGAALIKHFGANPYRIVSVKKSIFSQKMRVAAKGIRNISIEQLYQRAAASVSAGIPEPVHMLLEQRLRNLYEDFETHTKRKQEARKEMEDLYENLCVFDQRLPAEIPKVVTKFYLARILAETGPLSDFENARQLLRYAGIDLQVRQSGKYNGKTKISKRGRPVLRKVLSYAVLPLVKKNALYGKMYHEMRDQRKIPGAKAMMAIVRKFFKMLFGLYKTGTKFVPERVFKCASQYSIAA